MPLKRPLLQHISDRDPWFEVVVPAPSPDAGARQLLDYAALCGLVAANQQGGHLTDETRRAIAAYLHEYHDGEGVPG